ncbi:ABC-type nickel/cobalt efflux system permease component RcnA [Niabella hirudinis]
MPLKYLMRNISLLLLFGLGLFAIPKESYSCSKSKAIKTAHPTCEKKQVQTTEKKSCCKTETCKKNVNHEGHNCNGGCNHSSCQCSTSTTSVSLPFSVELSAKDLFASSEKKKFSFMKACYSSGFLSIWLPPKIS